MCVARVCCCASELPSAPLVSEEERKSAPDASEGEEEEEVDADDEDEDVEEAAVACLSVASCCSETNIGTTISDREASSHAM